MRVYVPLTLEELADHHRSGEVPAGQDRVLAAAEDEESEYAALIAAGETSAALHDARGTPGGRRVVLVAEVGEGREDEPIRLRRVVAVHADSAPGAAPDDDLAWFAVQEVPALLEGAS